MVEPQTASEALLLANINERGKNLYPLGYRAHWKDQDKGILLMTAPHGGVYELNVLAQTCECKFFGKTKGRFSCKHLLGWEELLKRQEAQERWLQEMQREWVRLQYFTVTDNEGWVNVYDVALGNHITGDGRDVEPFYPGDFGLSIATLEEHYQGLDLAHARTTNLCEPLLFITSSGVCHLIDGWHRLAHGLMQNVSALPAHVLSERERDAIQMARFPKTEGRNTRFSFSIGKLVLTPGAQEMLEEAKTPPTFPLWRHLTGDWGEVPEEDKRTNDVALKRGGRLFSAYALAIEQTLWIITEADRSVTTILTPDEY